MIRVPLRKHMQETCSHMSRDTTTLQTMSQRREQGQFKIKSRLHARVETCSPMDKENNMLDMSQKREQGQLFLQDCTTYREEKYLHMFLRIKRGFVRK